MLDFPALQPLNTFFSGVQGRLPTPRQRKCQGIRSGSQQPPGVGGVAARIILTILVVGMCVRVYTYVCIFICFL